MEQRRLVLTLYKTLLRLQRGLPSDLQLLGTQYLRDEFRRHKHVPPQEATTFIKQWMIYGTELSKQLNPKSLKQGLKNIKSLDEATLDEMTDEQIAQLYELMKASKQTEL